MKTDPSAVAVSQHQTNYSKDQHSKKFKKLMTNTWRVTKVQRRGMEGLSSGAPVRTELH